MAMQVTSECGDMSPPASYPNRMAYHIGRGEQGVLTFEPYKSHLLPLWRFRTAQIAEESSASLERKFLDYDANDDFVGMDMARKFLQMGMTRAKRYANYEGGRKYDKEAQERSKVEQGSKPEKEHASRIFREALDRCKRHKGYQQKKQQFLKDQRMWNYRKPSQKGPKAFPGDLGQSAQKRRKTGVQCCS